MGESDGDKEESDVGEIMKRKEMMMKITEKLHRVC